MMPCLTFHPYQLKSLFCVQCGIVFGANILIREIYLIIAVYFDRIIYIYIYFFFFRIIYINSKYSTVLMLVRLGKILAEKFYWLI